MPSTAAEHAIKLCPVCKSPMSATKPAWWHICQKCGMQASTLKPVFDKRPMAEMFDWKQRRSAFVDLRKANSERILNQLERVLPPPARLLDVGCAEGWFLRAAQERGYQAQGLEPDVRMVEASDKNLDIRTGFFPDGLLPQERFDVITFNDVFEHLPDVGAAMAACHRHLSTHGVLVINLPNADGGIYRLARALTLIGFTGPFERLWQEGYPSPHLTYFTPRTLLHLAGAHGFHEHTHNTLQAIEARGLWARIRCDRTKSWAYSAASWLAIMGALPLLALQPSDITVQIFGKTGKL